MVMEKSWNMTNWQKVIELCDQALDFAPALYQICEILRMSNKNKSFFANVSGS